MINMLDFIRQANFYKKFEVDELLFVEFKCPADDTQTGLWWHNNFFAFIISGETLVKTPNSETLLKPGDCIFSKKGSVLSISQTHDEFCELLVFVPDDFIKTVVQKYQITLALDSLVNKEDTVIPLTKDDVLESYFQSLFSYFTLNEPPPSTLLKLKFEELILHIASGKNNPFLKKYFIELCARSKPSISEIMEANFFSNLSLEEFARLCSRSLSGFKKEFIDIYKTTPGKWLLQKRLTYSRYLLQTTEKTIDEVCIESGFENKSHFMRVFKNKYGHTPGQLMMEKKH
jgi:AraC family transcriptional regulator, exoenzyme S synthesis regulatory protein ExsA